MSVKGKALSSAGVFCIILLASACSGGNTGPGPSVTPRATPTPVSSVVPTNSPPVVSIAQASGASLDEGQSFLLDASASTDSEGDVLSFSWRQTAGPAVTISNELTASASVVMPEVTADTVLSFEVDVSDGTDTVTATIDVTALNLVLAPTLNVFGDRVAGLTGLQNPRSVRIDSPSTADPFANITGIIDAPATLRFFNIVASDGVNFTSDIGLNIRGDAGTEVLRVSIDNQGAEEEIQLSPSERVLSYFTHPSRYVLVASSLVDLFPCAVEAFSTSNDAAVVLGREQGLTLHPLSLARGWARFDRALEMNGSGNYCQISSVEAERKLFAVNSDTGTLETWDIDFGGSLLSSVDLSLAAGYEVTDIVNFRIPDDSSNYVGVGITSGAYEGDQQFRIYQEIGGQLVLFQTLSWTKGAPGKLTYFFDARTGRWEIFAKLQDTPYVIFFGLYQEPWDPSLPDPPSPPDFFIEGYGEAGLGVTEIDVAGDYFSSGRGYLMTNSGAGTVDVIRRVN